MISAPVIDIFDASIPQGSISEAAADAIAVMLLSMVETEATLEAYNMQGDDE